MSEFAAGSALEMVAHCMWHQTDKNDRPRERRVHRGCGRDLYYIGQVGWLCPSCSDPNGWAEINAVDHEVVPLTETVCPICGAVRDIPPEKLNTSYLY